MCCALAALFIAVVAAWRRAVKTVGARLPRLRWMVTAAGAAMLLLGGSALAAQHFTHYAARAEANGRNVLAEILANPICSGAAVAESVATESVATESVATESAATESAVAESN